MKPLLYSWEIVRLLPDPYNEDKQFRCSLIIAAETIEQVWEWLASDRADERIEIECISRLGSIVSVIQSPEQPQ